MGLGRTPTEWDRLRQFVPFALPSAFFPSLSAHSFRDWELPTYWGEEKDLGTCDSLTLENGFEWGLGRVRGIAKSFITGTWVAFLENASFSHFSPDTH